jgi:murein DD-endopeptidase MepM/ murein hydrolase activator NlpD
MALRRVFLPLLLLPALTACPTPDGPTPPLEETPSIEVSATGVQITLQAGSAAQSQGVNIRNTGGGTLAWSAVSSVAWVSVSPASGSVGKGQSGGTTVTVNPAGMEPATYTASITISSPEASNGSQTINVTLVVTPAPTLSVSTASLSFASQVGGDPPAQTVSISNSGGGTLNWSASEDIPWLTVSPATGTLSSAQNAAAAVAVATAGLTAGTYNGTINFTASGASGSPKTIAVTLTITPAPAIGVSAASLSFTAQVGANPPEQALTVTNTGSGTLQWTASEPMAWLVGSPGTGSLSAGQSAAIALSVSTSGLTVGTYEGTITISAPGAANSPQSVPVSLVVTAAPVPALSVSPTSLTFSAQQGSNPASQTLTISNTGQGTLTWAASEALSWLVGTPGNGTLTAGQSATITFTANTAGLTPASYTGTITVAAPGAANSPQSVPVSLVVTAAPVPALSVSPTSLTFSTQQGSNPAGQTLTISNTGEGTLTWTASEPITWLVGSPGSGTLATGQSATITFTVNTAGLSPASYTGTITVTAPGAANSPRNIPVTLTVTASPAVLAVTPSALVLNGQVGSSPPAPTITISNSGGTALSWSASESLSWLNLSSTSGTVAAGGSASITASINTTGLAANTYTGTISLSAAGAIGSPKSVSVSLTLAPTSLTAPVLTSPADGATGIARTPTLSWNTVSGANQYWVTVATTQAALPADPSASTCAGCVVSVNTSATSLTVAATLAAGTTYYWRVQGYNNSTNPITQGQFSAIRSFSTITPAPVFRIDGGTSSTRPIGETFNLTGSGFTPNGAATRYVREPSGNEVNIGTVTANASGGIGWTFTPVCTTALGTYTLWVVDNATNVSSNTISETVTSSPSCTGLLPAPALSSPSNGATGVSTTPTFSWSAVAGANRYWLMVATDPGAFPTDPNATSCAGCLVSGNTGSTSHTLPSTFLSGRTATLASNTTYYWRVQGWNTDGRQGSYSAVSSFATAGASGFTWPKDPNNTSAGAFGYCADWPSHPSGCYWLNSNGWRDAQPYRRNLYSGHGYHLGADWNNGSGSSDANLPVYAVADGVVSRVADFGGAWGKVIFVRHSTPSGVYTSMYAHVNWNASGPPSQGQSVAKGQQIARIGNGNGYYGTAYHLHFELRVGDNTDPGLGYVTSQGAVSPQGQIDPDLFIRDHR